MLSRLQLHYNNRHSYLQLNALDNFAREFLFSLYVKIEIKNCFLQINTNPGIICEHFLSLYGACILHLLLV